MDFKEYSYAAAIKELKRRGEYEDFLFYCKDEGIKPDAFEMSAWLSLGDKNNY